jgi:RNA polymerase sigma-70 factor (ECF subfamily)
MAGDSGEAAFAELVEAHRGELHGHCYRMLGSLHDADDALQDTLLRAWRGLPRFRGGSSLRTWLYRIATNVCVDMINRRPKRVVPIDYGPAGATPAWIEPYPDAELVVADGAAGPEARYERRESLELAFVSALMHLPPRQRAALVLRDALGFSAKESAEALGTTVPAVNGALRRARASIEARLPEHSQQTTLRAIGDRRLSELVGRFADSFERGDVDGVLAMLADDATFSMPPHTEWCQGRAAIAESWLMPEGPPPRLRYVPTSANGQPALATYVREGEAGAYRPLALDVLTFRGEEIVAVTAFRTPAVFARFGLPGAV